MNSLREFEITLTLRGPILVKATGPFGFGIDASMARAFSRDDRPGPPCIPGTLIKGKLRDALTQVLEGKDTVKWLGRPSSSGVAPERGGLVFGDLVAAPPTNNAAPATNIHVICRTAIDHDTGTARDATLRTLEAPFAAGAEVEFRGTAYAYANDTDAEELRRMILLGLRWLTQVGSLRTTGLGRVLRTSVSLVTPASAPAARQAKAYEIFDVCLTPRGPLCISQHKTSDNLFESGDVIPGAMLAGAIKTTADRLGIDLPEFEKIRFRHAFPTTGSNRPRSLPLSTIKVGKLTYDVAAYGKPVLFNVGGQWRAADFPVDWKDASDAMATLGWASPMRELQVRTAVDGQKRTADRGADGGGGKLFAMEVLHPWARDNKPVVWRYRIDTGAVSAANRQKATENLLTVLDQLGFLSKTKARCSVTVSPVTQSVVELPRDRVVLTLQTATLLADPRFQALDGCPRSGALDAQQMLGLYKSVWSEISEGSLDLEHHFAQQRLVGGSYMRNRFPRLSTYDPWLLTEAGSVFCFALKDATKATELVNRWLRTGLPLPGWATTRYGSEWSENPYRPENGFGEVALHDSSFPRPDPGSIGEVATATTMVSKGAQ